MCDLVYGAGMKTSVVKGFSILIQRPVKEIFCLGTVANYVSFCWTLSSNVVTVIWDLKHLN